MAIKIKRCQGIDERRVNGSLNDDNEEDPEGHIKRQWLGVFRLNLRGLDDSRNRDFKTVKKT